MAAAWLAAAAGCGREAPDSAIAPVAATEAPAPFELVSERPHGIGGEGLNVLLVSVDTTRADHLGCYGHTGVDTPNIDRFAAEGTRFALCISSAPLTLPSHTTMLTGSYPFVHGARDNGIFFVDQDNVTLAEIFKDAGYATHAEVAAVVLNDRYGLDQGFDTYGDVEPREIKVNFRKLRHFAVTSDDEGEQVIDIPDPVGENERKAVSITDAGIALLTDKARAGEKFFIFLHYFDPHWPHEAPESFMSRFRDGYLAEISYFDEQFGRVLQAVKDLGLDDETLIVLTSDHGEGRGQHGEMTHSTFLYDTTLHVPLIFRAPGRVPAGQVVETQVRLLDIAPTIVDFVRLDRTEQMQGTSLLPLVAEPGRSERLVCYSDTLVPQHSLNYSPLRSLRTNDWKFILAPRNELYELSGDPDEIFNLAGIDESRVQAMRQEMWDLIAESPPPPGGRGSWRTPDSEEVRKLAALGYVSSTSMNDPSLTTGSELDHFEPVGLHPRDRLEVIESWAAGLGAYRVGDYVQAEKLYRRFMELEPDNAFGPSYLGRVLMQLKRYDEAIEMFRRSVQMSPDNYLDYSSLGMLLIFTREFEEAEQCLRKAIAYDDEDVANRLNLGIILAIQGEYEPALEQFDKAMEYATDEPPLHLHRGMVYRAQRRFDEAAAEFDAVLAVEPGHVRAREQLAITRHQQGRTAEGIALLEATILDAPSEGSLYRALSDLHMLSGDVMGAQSVLQRMVEVLPEDGLAHKNLGSSLVSSGSVREGIEHLRIATDLVPERPLVWQALARALAASGDEAGAAATWAKLVEVAPKLATAYVQGADLYVRLGRSADAMELLRQAYELMPDNIDILNDLAWRLATLPESEFRDGEQAVMIAEHVNSLKGGESCNELDTLAAAYAEVGRFDDAVSAARRAVMIARQGNQHDLATTIAARLELFEQGRPYRGK